MLTVAISLLFGFIAFAALAQIHWAVGHGVRRARLIAAELAAAQPGVRPHRPRARQVPRQPAIA